MSVSVSMSGSGAVGLGGGGGGSYQSGVYVPLRALIIFSVSFLPMVGILLIKMYKF